MIKKFFIAMLGSIAGIWISIFVFMLGLIFSIGILIGKNVDTESITEDKILLIDLSGSIVERAQNTTFQDIILSGETSAPLTLEDIVESLYAAKDDDHIKAVYLDCHGASSGYATREEIVSALNEFRNSGKPIIAYADAYQQADYMLASQADKIYLNPIGAVNIHGLQTQTMFYTDFLSKIGVQVQVFKVGDYKSAVEPFIRTDMSEPSRLQTRVFLDSLWQSVVTSMVRDGVDKSTILNLADSVASTLPAEKFLEKNLVTRLCYRHEVESELRSIVSVEENDDIPFITPAEYMLTVDRQSATSDHIAVLYAFGDIVESGEGGIASETLVPEIFRLAYDEHVKGLILRVNSGGGSAFASEQIWEALERFKETGKPFYVSMGDYAASGGYYISCGADSIYADQSTLTGSIGIFGMIPCARDLIKNKIGVNIDTVSTSANSTFPSLYFPANAVEAAAMQSSVERGYDIFTGRVAEGRKISQDSVKVIGGGRVWDGRSAVKIGLVDGIANLKDVVEIMTSNLDLGTCDVVSYPAIEDDIWNTLMELKSINATIDVNGIPTEDILPYIRTVRSFNNWYPLQARMEPIVVK